MLIIKDLPIMATGNFIIIILVEHIGDIHNNYYYAQKLISTDTLLNLAQYHSPMPYYIYPGRLNQVFVVSWHCG